VPGSGEELILREARTQRQNDAQKKIDENVLASWQRCYHRRVLFLNRADFAARISLSLLGAFVALISSAASAASPPAHDQFESLPLFRSRQNHLLVRAFINSKPALLIVDTGSPGTVIASKRRAHFGLTSVPENSDYPSRVQVNGSYNRLVMARTIQLGELNISDVPAVSADMSGPRRSSQVSHEPEADGIIGADVLFATKAILDCQRNLLILNLRPETPGTPPGVDLRGFQKMPMFVSERFNLYVDVSINGSPARLMVDTGAFATLLHRPFVRQLHIPMEETRLQSAALNLKEEGIDIARIRKLSVGLVNIVGKDVGVVDLGGILDHDMQRSPPAVGLLGAEILNRHHGIIDFGTRTLYLRGEVGPSEVKSPRKRTRAPMRY
jgi:predicted aspartyl protease